MSSVKLFCYTKFRSNSSQKSFLAVKFLFFYPCAATYAIFYFVFYFFFVDIKDERVLRVPVVRVATAPYPANLGVLHVKHTIH